MPNYGRTEYIFGRRYITSQELFLTNSRDMHLSWKEQKFNWGVQLGSVWIHHYGQWIGVKMVQFWNQFVIHLAFRNANLSTSTRAPLCSPLLLRTAFYLSEKVKNTPSIWKFWENWWLPLKNDSHADCCIFPPQFLDGFQGIVGKWNYGH